MKWYKTARMLRNHQRRKKHNKRFCSFSRGHCAKTVERALISIIRSVFHSTFVIYSTQRLNSLNFTSKSHVWSKGMFGYCLCLLNASNQLKCSMGIIKNIAVICLGVLVDLLLASFAFVTNDWLSSNRETKRHVNQIDEIYAWSVLVNRAWCSWLGVCVYMTKSKWFLIPYQKFYDRVKQCNKHHKNPPTIPCYRYCARFNKFSISNESHTPRHLLVI